MVPSVLLDNPLADGYVYGIVALLPLAALMLVIQTNPYQALVLRGILGAVAAMAYAVVGGADVALTEALVGTMLSITLYAVAVRSSLVMRVGILADDEVRDTSQWKPLLQHLRALLNGYQLRLDLVPYDTEAALHRALAEREIHATWRRRKLEQSASSGFPSLPDAAEPAYTIAIRVPRLYDIFAHELPPAMADVKPVGSALGGDRPIPPISPALEDQL